MPIKDVAVSIRRRLLNLAKSRGEDYQRLLTRYAIERLLFRLSRTEGAGGYILKGAMLFTTWSQNVARPTGDLDLLGQGNSDPATIIAMFTRACQVDVSEDGIIFDSATLDVEPVREAQSYRGVRVKLKAGLAGAVISVQVDIGFGDYVYPQPTRRYFPGLLENVPPASILMYPPEAVVAEKFEAMIRFGTSNGRLKDFHDMWVATRTFSFDLPTLAAAIRGTLQRRRTPIPVGTPEGLTPQFAAIAEERGLWRGFLRRTPPPLVPPPLTELLEELRRFFEPVITALADPGTASGRWDPAASGWY